MFCSAGIEPSLVVSSSSRQLGDEHPNPKSIFGRCLQIPIEPCWHLNLHQTSQMDKVDARMIFVSKDINIHIPARSCFFTSRAASGSCRQAGRKTGAVRWLLKDVDNRDYWPGCVAEDVPLNWARGCRLIMNAVKEVMGWHDFTCPRECTARELDGGLQKNRKSCQQFADVLDYLKEISLGKWLDCKILHAPIYIADIETHGTHLGTCMSL